MPAGLAFTVLTRFALFSFLFLFFFLFFFLPKHWCLIGPVWTAGYRKGKPDWSRAKNVDIQGVECATSGVLLPHNWNINTGLWLRHYVYERLVVKGIALLLALALPCGGGGFQLAFRVSHGHSHQARSLHSSCSSSPKP